MVVFTNQVRGLKLKKNMEFAQRQTKCSASSYLKLHKYSPPSWTSELTMQPNEAIGLAMTPTPIHEWDIPGLPERVKLFVKRDDLSGMQLSGNKVRKLEFLMAEALRQGSDSVITIGGIQSNHCRATATCATYLGLESHLILRNNQRQANEDPGLVGNLMIERLQGAHIHQVSKSEYASWGSEKITANLAAGLITKGKKPYVIPVGGSNSLGCWGYIKAMQEIIEQQGDGEKYTHIVMACGSGGTTAGIALANHLSGYGAQVIGFSVCDDEEYFYNYIDGLYEGLGASVSARDTVKIVQAKGGGYAVSRSEELESVLKAAMATGIVLDPVYSGKALHQLMVEIKQNPAEWEDCRILFIHTGGLLGMYDKSEQLMPLVEELDRAKRLVLTWPIPT